MADAPVRLVAILGSATPPGRLHRALVEALARARAGGGVDARLIDLGTLRIAPADGRAPDALLDDTEATIAEFASADAVVLATPVYRGSMTGTLKNLLDHVPVEALRDTPVAIVAMGATDHHHLGAERHLRDVLAFFGALVVPTAVYLSSRDFEDGAPGERASQELDAAISSSLTLARARIRPLGPAPLGAGPRERGSGGSGPPRSERARAS
jgi:FMN reductase